MNSIPFTGRALPSPFPAVSSSSSSRRHCVSLLLQLSRCPDSVSVRTSGRWEANLAAASLLGEYSYLNFLWSGQAPVYGGGRQSSSSSGAGFHMMQARSWKDHSDWRWNIQKLRGNPMEGELGVLGAESSDGAGVAPPIPEPYVGVGEPPSAVLTLDAPLSADIVPQVPGQGGRFRCEGTQRALQAYKVLDDKVWAEITKRSVVWAEITTEK
ncbi:hypothetical protein EJB05_25204, partial [Eragrostis curvula]